ncbi:class I SAM-dependent methyltransferase [Flavobacterium sp.]|uniref:class I SAM-dependent methyltransferase n=1 Tax=Flavobacterium sp. TaxID=239 RepID=UPI002B4B71BF|nr:class I SAM-dependent methyltransferase [Flavobacterium sp.]HLP63323.1 class I SAM-dependent methyltransferase [Flavobacterium sp.]
MEQTTNRKCTVCYETDTFLRNKKMSLYTCKNCNHTFTVIPREEEEPYNEDYFIEVHKNWFNNPDFKLFERVYNYSKKLLADEKIKMVDIGCGQGAFLKHILNTYKNDSLELSGIDIITNSYPGIKFESGDFLEMDFNENYNIITNFMVIEHVIDPHLFVNKMVKSLTKDGVIVINTINSGSLVYRVATFLNTLGFSSPHDRLFDHHHLQHYTNKSLVKLLEMEGLDIVKVENHNYPLKAVDTPASSPFMKAMYKFMLAGMFMVSKPLNFGMNQTLFCVKKNKTD